MNRYLFIGFVAASTAWVMALAYAFVLMGTAVWQSVALVYASILLIMLTMQRRACQGSNYQGSNYITEGVVAGNSTNTDTFTDASVSVNNSASATLSDTVSRPVDRGKLHNALPVSTSQWTSINVQPISNQPSPAQSTASLSAVPVCNANTSFLNHSDQCVRLRPVVPHANYSQSHYYQSGSNVRVSVQVEEQHTSESRASDFYRFYRRNSGHARRYPTGIRSVGSVHSLLQAQLSRAQQND